MRAKSSLSITHWAVQYLYRMLLTRCDKRLIGFVDAIVPMERQIYPPDDLPRNLGLCSASLFRLWYLTCKTKNTKKPGHEHNDELAFQLTARYSPTESITLMQYSTSTEQYCLGYIVTV